MSIIPPTMYREFQTSVQYADAFSRFIEKDPNSGRFPSYSTEEVIKSGTFVTFGSTNNTVKAVSSTTDKILGYVRKREADLLNARRDTKSTFKIGEEISFNREMAYLDKICNVNISFGQQLYIDITNADLTKRGYITNISTNNVLIPNAFALWSSIIDSSGSKFVTFNFESII